MGSIRNYLDEMQISPQTSYAVLYETKGFSLLVLPSSDVCTSQGSRSVQPINVGNACFLT